MKLFTYYFPFAFGRNYLVSATNLIHYLAPHCLDFQQLTDELSLIGLLNLECANPHVLGSITSAIQLLEKQAPNSYSTELHRWDASVPECATSLENEKVMEFSISAMRTRASMHATALLGTVRDEKDVHNIMVTVGKEAIAKQMLLPDLLKAGANIIRINCAHDDPSIWSEIIRRAKHSSQMLEKPCHILMDLAGPKLRTGLLNRGPNVIKISPKKDAKGDMIVPAQVWLSFSGCGPPHISPDAVLFVESERFVSKLEVGNVIRFVDVRGRKRSLRVSKKYSVFAGYGYMVECTRTTYVESGTRLRIERKKGKNSIGHVVNVPAAEQFIRLRVGDLLTICRELSLSTSTPGGSSFGARKITCALGAFLTLLNLVSPLRLMMGKSGVLSKVQAIMRLLSQSLMQAPKVLN